MSSEFARGVPAKAARRTQTPGLACGANAVCLSLHGVFLPGRRRESGGLQWGAAAPALYCLAGAQSEGGNDLTSSSRVSPHWLWCLSSCPWGPGLSLSKSGPKSLTDTSARQPHWSIHCVDSCALVCTVQFSLLAFYLNAKCNRIGWNWVL